MSGGWGNSPWGISVFGTGASGPGGLSVSNISPPSGLAIPRSAPISFDVTGPGTLQIIIAAEYADSGIVELVYDNSVLTPYYRNSSDDASVISGGFHFSLLRTPEWPGDMVRIRVYATDSGGDMLIVTLGWIVEEDTFVATPTTVSAPAERTSFDPLGFGPVRPFRRVSTNDFDTASGEELVRASVGQILGTGIGEIPWRPRFGTTLSRLKHMRNAAQLPEIARLSIQEALSRWEPRVSISELTAEPVSAGNENKVLLSLSYRISNSTPATVKVLV